MAVHLVTDESTRNHALLAASAAIATGQLVVFPTRHAYVVACDPFTPRATARLRDLLHHPRNQPFSVMVASRDRVAGVAAELTNPAQVLIQEFLPGDLTLICHSHPTLRWDLGDTHGTVAVTVPEKGVAQQLVSLTGPLAVTRALRGHMPQHDGTAGQTLGQGPQTIDGDSAAADDTQANEPTTLSAATDGVKRTGDVAKAAGPNETTPQPLEDSVERAQTLYGDSVAEYLDDGPRNGERVSSIVDTTVNPPLLVRQGALTYERLKAVCPQLKHLM